MAGTNETQPQETFKQQLDRAAEDGRTGADSQHSSRPIVDKSKHTTDPSHANSLGPEGVGLEIRLAN